MEDKTIQAIAIVGAICLWFIPFILEYRSGGKSREKAIESALVVIVYTVIAIIYFFADNIPKQIENITMAALIFLIIFRFNKIVLGRER
jgi:hypothetical protein